ncbi:MAG: hypothetical protein JEY94_01765 [Melioribacteraceae bacterium]|nr:hypothetical protein [Melioribacteraceae bacterium]
MSDGSKYDFFMNELNSLEKLVNVFIHKNLEVTEKNHELFNKLNTLKDENEVLRLKNEELEERLNELELQKEGLVNSFKGDDKEKIIKVIDGLISNIDYHLRS